VGSDSCISHRRTYGEPNQGLQRWIRISRWTLKNPSTLMQTMDSHTTTTRIFHSKLVVYSPPGRQISPPLATGSHPAQARRRSARLSHRQGKPKGQQTRLPILWTPLVCLDHPLITTTRELTRSLCGVCIASCFIQTGHALSQYLRRCTSGVPGRIIGPTSGASLYIKTSQLTRLLFVSPTLFASLPAFSTSPASLPCGLK